CWLALDRPSKAGRAAGLAEVMAAAVPLPLAATWAGRAAAAVALDAGDAAVAAKRALASADTADAAGAPSRPRCRARSRAERSPRPATRIGLLPKLSTRRQRSTHAAHGATAKARSESCESSDITSTGAPGQAPPTRLASNH